MTTSILLGMVGPWQVVLIVAVVVLMFGGRKLPELMKGIGTGMKEFKKAVSDEGKTEEEEKVEIESEKILNK